MGEPSCSRKLPASLPPPRGRGLRLGLACLGLLGLAGGLRAAPPGHREQPEDAPAPVLGPRLTSPPGTVTRNGFTSVQVNVDPQGNNILGDAGNEPSIAVDPVDPSRLAIGWRQFDSVNNNFRQAGYAFSRDGGGSWAFPGVLDPGVFRSDPVLEADASGTFYYHSLRAAGGSFWCDVFRSTDGGVTWSSPVYAYGGDKAWLAVDRSGGAGHGNLYAAWDDAGCCGDDWFNRSRDGARSFEAPVPIPERPIYGVTAVGPDGEVYTAGRRLSTGDEFVVARSSGAANPAAPPVFDYAVQVDMGGSLVDSVRNGPNEIGLHGQAWVAVDRSTGPRRGHVYLLSSVDPPGNDPLDVHIARSTDGGRTWSAPVRVNDDPPGTRAWHWFGTMDVAPNGRIDAVWNDTRDDPGGIGSALRYAYSLDGGATWTASLEVGPLFDPHAGWPRQNKLGDYYDMVSDRTGAHVAYAATYNGEQDVYHVRIDCHSTRTGNLDPRSLRMVKGEVAGGCAAGDILASWRELTLPVVQTYNLHEIVGFTERSRIANPYPGDALGSTAGSLELCQAPSLVPPVNVGYYGVFQANECSGLSFADP